jgi:hypothetical protein
MKFSHDSILISSVVLAVLFLYAAAVSAADGDEEVAVPDVVVASEGASEEIEEIVVYAYRSGDKIDVDARYEELFRSRASMELGRLEVLDEEYQWRKTMSENESESRIKWGYNPEAEQAMRRDTELSNESADNTYGKPATLFRATF